MDRPIVTFTSDFGTSDGYAGAMKGAVLGVNSAAAVVDISHDVPPQDVAHGAFVLAGGCLSFTPAAIHVCVVDPGVGTERKALLLDTPIGRFLAPDNGLLTMVLARYCLDSGVEPAVGPARAVMAPGQGKVPAGCNAFSLDRPEYWRHPVSETFHGRDVFAPVAGHLSLGARSEDVGSEVDDIVWLNFPSPEKRNGAIEGSVVYVDRFGNLTTNIRRSDLPGGKIEAEVGGATVRGLSSAYADGPDLVALIGSEGFLEVAERYGNAARMLAVGVGAPVTVMAS